MKKSFEKNENLSWKCFFCSYRTLKYIFGLETELKPPVLGGKDMASPTCMIWLHCRNLVTVNDLWSPHTLYGMWEHCNYQWLWWSLLTLYRTVSYGPPTCTIWFFQDSFEGGPLQVLIRTFTNISVTSFATSRKLFNIYKCIYIIFKLNVSLAVAFVHEYKYFNRK